MREEGENLVPTISVVIPCFRAGEYLAEAIESVLSQSEEDWELILVDNNASIETKEVIQRYQVYNKNKIRIFYEKNQGSSSSRNRGFMEARGEYIAFLDDDDIMYPDRLALQKKTLNDHPEAVLCYGRIDKVSHDNKTVLESMAKDEDFPFFISSSPFIGRKVCLRFPEPRPSSIMLRKEAAKSIKFFDEHFNPILLEETDFYFRMAQKGTFIEVEQSIIRFRMPSPEFLQRKRIDNVRKFRLLLNQDYFYSKIRYFLKEYNLLENPWVKKDLKRMKARWLREMSFDFLATPKGERFARILLWKAIKENPSELKSIKHLIRSYYPLSKRIKKYASTQIYENGIPEEITEEFLLSLFENDHFCKFCLPSENAG